MKERKGCIFSISQDNVPVAGCTISKDVVHQEDCQVLYFSLAAQTDISPETYDQVKILYVTAGTLCLYGPEGEREVPQGQVYIARPGIPVGMKNPTSGDLSVMMNSIEAAQNEQDFLFHGWEVHTTGNPLAHAILRGYVNHFGTSMPNYHYENLKKVLDLYGERTLANPAIVVDCNHNNSGKKYMEQIRIAKDVMASRRYSSDVAGTVKGLMIESYIEDGSQKIGEGVYGKSITDPCLGWEKSRALILELAELV